MGGIKVHTFKEWVVVVVKSKKVKLMVAKHWAKEELINFQAWANLVRRTKLVKAKFASKLVGLTRHMYEIWRIVVTQNKKLKQMMLKHMMGSLRLVYQEWARYTNTSSVRARRLLGTQMLGLEKAILRAWHTTAREEHKARLEHGILHNRFTPQDFFVPGEFSVGKFPFQQGMGLPNPKVRPSLRELCLAQEREWLGNEARGHEAKEDASRHVKLRA